MAGSIKNINVKIGADATKFDSVLRNTDKSIKSTSSELRKVNSNLRFDPTSTEMLTQKQTLLAEQVNSTKERLDALKEAQRQMDAGEVEFTAEQYRELEREINYTERRLDSLTKQQAQFSDISAVQLQELGKQWQAQGREITEFGNKLTTSVTLPALAAGAALATVALTKGWSRLVAIDDARAKLQGLGHDAENIDSIMTSATASVKGTAFALGDAATAAASAVAAGVQEGEALTRYLSLTADAAAIAGTEFYQMGDIFNKITTKGRANMGLLNQVATAGIPIYQWLADELQVTADEATKMATAGKISSEDFLNAVEKNIGGAAKMMGEVSLTAAIDNTGAAIARVGAAFLDAGGQGGGFFSQMKPLMGEFMHGIDSMEDGAAEAGVKVGKAFSDIVSGTKDVVEWYGNLSSGGQNVIKTLGLLAVTSGPLVSVTGHLITGTGRLITSVGLLKGAMVGETIATKAATGAQLALNAAWKANPAGVILAGVSLLAAGIAYLAGKSKDAAKANEQLTASSEAQKKKVNELSSAYDDAVSKHGETSDAALKAKAALDEETKAFESSKQTIEDFTESVNDAVESHDSLMESIQDSQDKANAQAGVILNLADQYAQLASSQNMSADDAAKLAAVKESLAAQSTDLANALGAQGEAASITTEQVQALAKAEADRLKADSANKAYLDLLQDEQDLKIKIETATEELRLADERRADENRSAYYLGTSEGHKEQKAIEELTEAQDEATKSLEENSEKQKAAIKIIQETAVKTSNTKAAVQAYEKGLLTVAQAAERYGLTTEEVNEAIEQQALITEAQAVVAVNELTEALIEYASENENLTTTLSNAGLSIDDVSAKMQEQGISVDDLKNRINEYRDQAIDAFNEIEINQENNAEKAITTLTNNIAATQEWKDNLTWLYSESGLSFNTEFIDQLNAGGVENYGLFLAQLKDATQNDMDIVVGDVSYSAQEIIDLFGTAGIEATAAGFAASGIILDDAQATAESMKGTIEQGATAGGESVPGNVASGAESNMGELDSLAANIQAGLTNSFDSLDFTGVGSKIPGDIIEGIASGTANLSTSIESIKTGIETSLDSLDLKPQGTSAITKFTLGVTSNQALAIAAFTSIVTGSLATMNALVSASYSIGEQSAKGLANGVLNNRASVESAFSSVISSAIAKGNAAADIHSPSRKTAWTGAMMIAGLAGQIDKDGHKVADSFGTAIQSAIGIGESAAKFPMPSVSSFSDSAFTVKAEVQGFSSDVNKVLDRLDRLEKSIANMEVIAEINVNKEFKRTVNNIKEGR